MVYSIIKIKKYWLYKLYQYRGRIYDNISPEMLYVIC